MTYPTNVWCPNPSCPLGQQGKMGGILLNVETICGGCEVARYQCEYCRWRFTYKSQEQEKLQKVFG